MKFVPIKEQMVETIQKAEMANNATKETSNIGNNVIAQIRDKGMSIYEEVAILRKTIALLCKQIGVTYDEFNEYNTFVEECKAKAKEENESSAK